MELALFASGTHGRGFEDNTAYDTQTVNLTASYTPTPDNHHGLARLGYEQAGGPFNGFGTFVEAVAQDGAFLDSADLLTTPSDMILNASVPYAVDLPGPYAKRVILYLEARNLLDRTYAASVQNLANSVDPRTGLQNAAAVLAATPGSLLAVAPRNIVGGMKLAF